MFQSEINVSEVAILSRILEPDKANLPAEAAKVMLGLDFSAADKDRMRQLSAKAREGSLSPEEKTAIRNYELVGHLLNMMQSKARRSLTDRSTTDRQKKSP